MRITVFGLDKRFGYAARTLTERGFQTVRYEPESDLSGVLLLPLPASRGGDTVTGYPAVRLSDLLEGKPRAIVGGNLSGSFISAARRAGIAVRDYMNVEAFVLKNASLTAEAALGILLSDSPAAPRENPTAILGFGRIGKFLCRGLLSLGCPVTVFARDPRERVMATLIGARAKDTALLAGAGALRGFRTLVNTVPARLLSREALGDLPAGSLVLELASGDGNLPLSLPDRGAVFRRENGLPGRVFPESAGIALGETVCGLLRELFPDEVEKE